ncbi:MAG: hypothetical protein AB1483_08870 [Candidatus Zixiibacteriota bacterium]
MIPSENILYDTRAWAILSRSFELERTAGTYLFYGPDGVGRWLLAVSFAALLNCEKPERSDSEAKMLVPCGQCRNCRNIFALNFEGLQFAVPIPPHENKPEKAVEFTAEFIQQKKQEPFRIISDVKTQTIPISIARMIKKNLSLKADSEIRRVVVFYQMEKMLLSSGDALLKMIEEPPADTVIIIITSNPDSLLKTIQSRSQKIKVDRQPPQVIEKYLAGHYKVSTKKAQLVARISEGSVGRALDALGSDNEDDVSSRAVAFLLFKSLFLDPAPDTLAHMNDVLNLRDRGEAEELLRLWQLLIRDCAGMAVTSDEGEITNVDFAGDIGRLSGYFADSRLTVRMTEDIKNTLADLRLNVHIQGALMALALKLKRNISAVN